MSRTTLNAYLHNLSGQLVLRSLGIVSTLILVRMLSPSDFGIVAIGVMVVGFFEVISTSGASRYLMLQKNAPDALYNSAWTLDVLLKGIATITLLLSAPYIAEFLDNENLTHVLWLLCIIKYLGAFRNIGLIKDQRQLNFASTNIILVAAKLCSFFATITIAFTLKNYYALIVGTLINVLVDVFLSYKICKYRPRLNVNFDRQMFSFSKTLLFRNFIGYSRSQLDVFLIGKSFGMQGTGEYSIARQFSILPLTEVVSPATQPILASLSKLKQRTDELYSGIYKSFFVVFVFIVPSTVGLYLVAEPFTAVVLGEKWMSVASYIGVLGFLMLPFSVQPIMHIAYDTFNKAQYSVITDIFGIVAIVAGFYFLMPGTITEYADLRVLIGVLAFLLSFLLAKYFLNISIITVFAIVFIPIICATVMFLVLYFVQASTDFSAPVELIIISTLGISIYILSFYIMLNIMKMLGVYTKYIGFIPDFILIRLSKFV